MVLVLAGLPFSVQAVLRKSRSAFWSTRRGEDASSVTCDSLASSAAQPMLKFQVADLRVFPEEEGFPMEAMPRQRWRALCLDSRSGRSLRRPSDECASASDPGLCGPTRTHAVTTQQGDLFPHRASCIGSAEIGI